MGKTNLMTASNQWASRPADERFWGLEDLKAFLEEERDLTGSRTVKTHDLKAVANGRELMLMGPQGNPARLSNWSFQQVCSLTHSPASFLRELPTDHVERILNHRIPQHTAENSDSSLLIRKNGDMLIRALTTTIYGRIWDLDIVNHLLPSLNQGWRVPPARPVGNDPRARPATKADILPNQGDFGLSVKEGDMIGPAGVYRGDRDMFIFWVNPNRVIDDGSNGGLMRGAFFWNSEVGKGAFWGRTFYLENVCGNHICWGASHMQTFKVIHKVGSIKNYAKKINQALAIYSNASTQEEEAMIRKAREHTIGENMDAVVEKLYGMKKLALNKLVIEEAYKTAEQWEHTALSPPNTSWGFVHGLTRYSQTFQNADERNRLDRVGGKILQMAAGGQSY